MLLFAFVVLFGLGSNADAAEPKKITTKAVTVATVNVYNQKIVSQNNLDITVSFDITNEIGTQAGIMYSIGLIAEEEDGTQKIIHQKVYSEDVLSLVERDSISKIITYSAPSYVKGRYELFVQVGNSNGLPFGIVPVGKVEFNGNGEQVSALGCFLTIDGEQGLKKYELLQGTDVEKNETLMLNCEILNNLDRQISIMPIIETRLRTVFGKNVSNEKGAQLDLEPGQKTAWKFVIPKLTEPQAYQGNINFLDIATNEIISSNITARYVLRGLSATIQNVVFDKSGYEAGEIAKASFFWSASADSFPGSRKGKTQFTGGNLRILMKNSEGQVCGPEKIERVSAENDGKIINLEMAITAKCTNPKIAVVIEDGAGLVLAKNDLSIITKNSPTNAINNNELLFGINANKIFVVSVIVIIVLIVLSGIFLLMLKKRRMKMMDTAKMLLLGAFLFSSLLFANNNAKATNFTDAEGASYDVYFTNSHYYDGTLHYYPGENMTIEFITNFLWCTNTIKDVYVYAQAYKKSFLGLYLASGSPVLLLDGDYSGTPKTTSIFNTISMPAGSSIGDYYVQFDVSYFDSADNYTYETAFNMPYLVVNPPVIPKTGTDGVCGSASGGTFATLTATSPNLCGIGMSVLSFSGTGPWTWYCSGINGGADSPQCSANKTAVASCLDGIKNGTETGVDCGGTCPACAAAAFCGDGSCNGVETSITCPADCSVSAFCGDGTCNGSETTATCPSDCPAAAIPKPSFTLSASPSIIDLESASLPRTITLTWSPVSNATSCLKSPTMGGGNAAITGGTATVSQSSSSATYFIICSGPGGQTQKSATVQTRCTNTTCISSNTICDINYIYNIATNTCSKECTTNASCSAALPTTPTTTGGNQIPWMEVTP